MKIRLIKLFLLLLLIAGAGRGYGQTVVYNSPNAGVDGSRVQDMVHMDYRTIYTMGADMSGGIIGQVSSGGSIRLEVFEYDPARPQGIGDLVYGKVSTGTTTDYGGIAETHSVTGTRINNVIIVMTDNVKALGQKSRIYATGTNFTCLPASATLTSSVMGDGLIPETEPCTALERYQPVIIKVTQTNATAFSVRVPGIGTYYLPNKNHRPFASYAGPFGRVTVGAHRGIWESNQDPENTPRALRKALARNVDMIELDIAITSDGVPVIFHDNGLTKRTSIVGGPITSFPFSRLDGIPIRNRFDEILYIGPDEDGLLSLDKALAVLQSDPKKTFINIDKSANDMATFKKVYQIVAARGMLDRCIFKGRFDGVNDSPTDVNKPTVAGLRQAFADMFPNVSVQDRENLIRDMYFTPVLFDNGGSNYDDTKANLFYQYMNGFILAGFADGFELNFKAFPAGSANYATDNNSNIIMLRPWTVLGNQNFVSWVHSFNLPVGVFASEPEVGAAPQYTGLPNERDMNNLVSGTVWEPNFLPEIRDQPVYDFRGDPGFYLAAGADYVITDRPDQLTAYLRAISRSTH